MRLFSGIAAVRSSFALNHALMLLTFVLAIESLSRAICGLERLAGFDTTPIIRNAHLSRTVSEFWRRYNDRVHNWLYHNVFLMTGGRRAPVRSLLLVFLVSGLFHEAMFALATSRLTGYQFAFFAIQGPAALASGRLERLARRGGVAGKVTAHAATILFVAVTSVLFFDGVGKIVPFLDASRSPLETCRLDDSSENGRDARFGHSQLKPRSIPGPLRGKASTGSTSEPLPMDSRIGANITGEAGV